MASSQLGSYTAGSGTRKMVRTRSGGQSAAAMKQLLSKLRSTWRRSSGSGRPAASFGYDLQSYSLNFDDGLGSSAGHHRFQTSVVIPCN
ncbi:unnamed protein product [Urochloa decumbens]|uniref:Uncharacterized protein n=1 Tax=Urochloa decumbens TaxID=240449 RepID=A0ABC8XZG6_9POAL